MKSIKNLSSNFIGFAKNNPIFLLSAIVGGLSYSANLSLKIASLLQNKRLIDLDENLWHSKKFSLLPGEGTTKKIGALERAILSISGNLLPVIQIYTMLMVAAIRVYSGGFAAIPRSAKSLLETMKNNPISSAAIFFLPLALIAESVENKIAARKYSATEPKKIFDLNGNFPIILAPVIAIGIITCRKASELAAKIR